MVKCHSFRDAKKIAKQLLNDGKLDLQVTYGTRVKRFCFIDKSDRDYGRFGISLKDFVKLDKLDLTRKGDGNFKATLNGVVFYF